VRLPPVAPQEMHVGFFDSVDTTCVTSTSSMANKSSELASGLVARRAEYVSVRIGAVDGQAKADRFEQERMREVLLRERVADPENIGLHGPRRSAVLCLRA
jgi:hypothetical protein